MFKRSTLLIAFVLVCACGSTATPVATVTPTPSPSPSPDPSSVARLEGTYDVTYTVTAMSGATTDVRMGEKTRRVWTATPKCATGPCDTDIKAQAPPPGGITYSVLTFSGGAYHLSQSFIGGDCGRTTHQNAFDNAITILITPSRFATVGASTVLYVAELTGTRTQVGTPRAIAMRLGCKKSFTYTFSALIVRKS
jgi:hypothetical protein